ncbi:MAG: response regulator, partial [Planctomycetota bacterium]|nr:response regulator [Planctomycetota bacterium]
SFLQKSGCSISIAGDGRQAVEAVSAGRAFDLVLMDIDMPILDGLAATKEIRALGGRCADLPILAMTANVVPEDRAACFEAGMNGWLGKPFDRASIAEALIDIARGRG